MADSKPATSSKGERLRALLPEIYVLLRARRGLLLMGGLLVLVNRAAGLVLPASTKFLIDDVIGAGRAERLLPLVAVVVAATLVQGGTSYWLTQTLSMAAQRLIAELRRDLQAHVGRLPVAFFDTHKSGDLATRVMSDAEGLRNLVGTGLVELAGGLLTACLAFLLMLRLSPAMTGLTLVALIVFGVVLGRAMGSMRPVFRERGKLYAEVYGRLSESLSGVRVVKGYHAEAREAQTFAGGVGRLLENVLKTLGSMAFLSLSSSALLGLLGAAVMWLGATQVLHGSMTLGGLFTYTVLLGFLVGPVFQVVSVGTQLQEALAGLERMRELKRERREDDDPLRTELLPRLVGHVELRDVSFAYEPGRPVLQGISLRAEAGSVTALVGPSGAGKSTLIGLLTAFHAPTEGQVLVDGFDLRHVQLGSFRSQLGVVLQESFLFDGTIRENVAFARPSATTEEVVAACRLARVDEFAEALPQGYDTVVGERGIKLSGGQRQRVSIARAVLADPRLLILDEATSSLDSKSEALIQEGLQHLMEGRTTFVIAHRLSTIRRADRILVLEQGRVVEAGTHRELLLLRGAYFEMYRIQHAVESDLFLAPGEGAAEPAEQPVSRPAPPGARGVVPTL